MTARAVIHCDAARHGYAWHVDFDGERIVTSSRDPEHDACRALLARGITGHIEFIDGVTGKRRMRFDIEEGARWRMSEEDRDGLRRRKWVARPDNPARTRQTEPAGVGDRPAVGSDWRRAS